MTRGSRDRLDDILVAATAIANHLARGDLKDPLVFDAVRARLIELGQAVKSIETSVLDREPDIPWLDIAAMRDQLAHRYFATDERIVRATVDRDLPALVAAVQRLVESTREP